MVVLFLSKRITGIKVLFKRQFGKCFSIDLLKLTRSFPGTLGSLNLTHSFETFFDGTLAANIYLFKVKNRNPRKSCEMCSNLTVKTPKRRLCWSLI